MSTAATVADVAEDEARTWRAIVDRARAMLDACDPADLLGLAIMGDALARAQEIAAKADEVAAAVRAARHTNSAALQTWLAAAPPDGSQPH